MRILLIEDEKSVAAFIKRASKRNSIAWMWLTTGKKGC
jgi:DNA-binding response OmpR family regulator